MSRIPLILGAGMWGYPETQSRIQDLETAQRMIDVMLSHHYIGIDSAQNYGEGTSEKMLGALDLKGQARVDTKIFPLHSEDFKSSKVKEAIKKSLVDLGPHKIRVFYLHNPDRATPFEETLGAINDLYKQGIFEEFGLSNFMSWEVAEVVGICERRGFIKPTVYQGIYNLLDRTPEGELFPCLRKFGIRFAAYSTLAGGYLTGKHLDPSIEAKAVAIEDKNSHYNPEWPQSWFYLTRYPPMAAAVSKLKAVSDKHEIALAEVAYRWLQWHSAMIPGDQGVILGASRVEQLEAAISSSSKGPLPEEVVKACEQAWLEVRGVAKNYWLESSIVQIISDTH